LISSVYSHILIEESEDSNLELEENYRKIKQKYKGIKRELKNTIREGRQRANNYEEKDKLSTIKSHNSLRSDSPYELEIEEIPTSQGKETKTGNTH